MSEKFYSLLTNIGKAKIANSVGLGTKINFSIMKVGDGGGSYYDPTEDQTDLKNVVWQGNINHVEIDEENSNWINIEVMIPSTVGGFTIREYGAFDEEGNMLGICKCAETYKPVIADGSTKELLLNLVLAISNTSTVSLKVDPTIIFAKKSEVEQLRADINTQLSDMVYQIAGGTATALTLTIRGSLVNGYPITFIASGSNGGVATKINGKSVYKPGTTTPPNFIKDKAYTVWYNSISDCFFIKASAEGDADVSHVLATKKFSNDNDTGLVGTMPNNGAINYSMPINGSFTIPLGYTTGGKITQSITTKSAQTYNPSTIAQTIASGQYLSGVQTIAPVTGNATINDVVSGKVFSSASGINLVGQATIQSLGGYKFSVGTYVINISGKDTSFISSEISVSLGYQPLYYVGWFVPNNQSGAMAQMRIVLPNLNAYMGGEVSAPSVAHDSWITRARGDYGDFLDATTTGFTIKTIVSNGTVYYFAIY
ncbi:phage tail protein [Clostridium sp. YIM B02569]|uniref:phage tail protein n=1 Tax=Clostridium sp. YIM B02569 TaxID=2911967 RepID=UPI001EEA3DF4|nr:phage tail protein [Clostridium sp. YIM B02569]